jgi:hypothetical protein
MSEQDTKQLILCPSTDINGRNMRRRNKVRSRAREIAKEE